MGSKNVFISLLELAERRFGDRSRNLKIKVNGRDDDIPETVSLGADKCCVYYYRKAKQHEQRLRFQLAHEAIHVLSGALKRKALKLEEGLAVWFSLDVLDDHSYRDQARVSLSPIFKEALELFEQLTPSDNAIAALRACCSCLDEVAPQHLKQVFGCSHELAVKLCERVPEDMHLRRLLT